MAPVTPITPTPRLFPRSSSDSCGYYSTTCGRHRTAVLIIIIAIGTLVACLLLYYYLRKRAFVHAGPSRFRPGLQNQHTKTARASWRRDEEEGDAALELPRYEAPPPYMPCQPEDVHVHGMRGT